MKSHLRFIVSFFALTSLVCAEVAPVKLEKTPEQAWVGERVAFFLELRSPASFSGTATFDIPHLPGTTVIQVGSPVVSSEEIEDEQWSIQRHEFALFCQRSGTLTVPEIKVRFTRKETFTGPEKEVVGTSPVWSINIEQPPGSEKIGHLITTESFEVTEEWEPTPGDAKVGDVFKRTVKQQASNVSGMALSPLSKKVPKGIKVYAGEVNTSDKEVRGELSGNRQETVTYLLTGDGQISLPALKYVWWNPKKKELQSKTLPAVTFIVKPAPVPNTNEPETEDFGLWFWLIGAILIATGCAFTQRSRIQQFFLASWNRLNPPDRVAARKLLRACRSNNTDTAESAWTAWLQTQSFEIKFDTELAYAITELHRYRFTESHESPWQGERLYVAFKQHLRNSRTLFHQKKRAALPPLNP